MSRWRLRIRFRVCVKVLDASLADVHELIKTITVNIRNQTDFAAGLLYIVLGGFAAYVASGYTMGTAADMGTGFFPFWLGVILAVIGLAICISSVTAGAVRETLSSWDWKALTWICLAILAFAFLFELAGMVLSIFALVLVSSAASRRFRWRGAIVNACVLNVICYVAFVWLLNIPLQVWPDLQF